MFCEKCGAEISTNSHYCSKCGNPMLKQKNISADNKNELLRQKINKNKVLLIISSVICVVFSILIIAILFIVYDTQDISDYKAKSYFLNMGFIVIPFIVTNAILCWKFLKVNNTLEEIIRIIDFGTDYKKLNALFDSIKIKKFYLILPILLCGTFVGIPFYIVQILAIHSTNELYKYYSVYKNTNT